MSFDLAPGRDFDRWVIEELLGRGGMASVWRVRHRDLGTVCALKVLDIPRSDLRERMMREGRLQASVSHPNVLSVVDVLQAQTGIGLVIEFVDGPDLGRWLATGPPPLAQAEEIVRGVLAGVAAAHASGLVHRDIKPQNVLLQISGHSVIPKVCDFGLARSVDADDDGARTRTGVTMGTIAYMAPEQARSARRADQRSDVFALGVLAYNVLTGFLPFPPDDLIERVGCIERGYFLRLREMRPEVSTLMADGVERALRANPEERFANAGAFLTAISGTTIEEPSVFDAASVQRLRSLTPRTPTPPGPSEPRIGPDGQAHVVRSHEPRHEPTTPPSMPPTDGGLSSERGDDRRVSGALVATLLAVGVALVAGLVLVAMLVGWWLSVGQTGDVVIVPAVSSEVEVEPAAPPEEPAATPLAVQPVVEEPVVEPQVVVRVPRTNPKVENTATVEPAVEVVSTPAPPTGSRVDVQGVERAFLLDAAGVRHPPGALPPGHYTLSVFFEASTPQAALEIDLVKDEQRTIVCKPRLKVCR